MYVLPHMQWSLRMEGPDAAPPRFLEIQAGCDLLVWKRDYFCGVSYATVCTAYLMMLSRGMRLGDVHLCQCASAHTDMHDRCLQVLRHAERRGRRAALDGVRKGPSLVKGLNERSEMWCRVSVRCRQLYVCMHACMLYWEHKQSDGGMADIRRSWRASSTNHGCSCAISRKSILQMTHRARG